MQTAKIEKANKYHYWFDTSDVKTDLKNKSVKGGISTTTSQFIVFGLNTLSTIVMARILLPADFGLIAMATAFLGFANVLKDFGLSMAVIQKNTITHEQVTNVFWMNVLICFCLALIFAGCAPLIVGLYKEPRLLWITFAYAAGILISSFSLQHSALLSRQMKFSKIAVINITAAFISMIAAIISAVLGLGYWSIVLLNISQILLTTIFMWIFCTWRPGLPAKKSGVKSFMHFGAGITGFNLINYFSRNMDNILIGKYLGASTLGFYSKAYQLLMLPLTQLRDPLTSVGIPGLSSLKNDPWKYRNYFRRYLFLLAFFSMPLVAYLGIYSDTLIIIVLGNQWISSSHIFQLLAISAFIQPVAGTRGLILISTGQSNKFFIWGLINAAFTILSFFIGIRWGVEGLAVGYAIVNYLLLVPSLYFCFSNTPVSVLLFFKELFQPFIHTAILFIMMFFMNRLLHDKLPHLLLFGITTLVSISCYYASWMLYPAGREKIQYVNELLLQFIKKIKRKR